PEQEGRQHHAYNADEGSGQHHPVDPHRLRIAAGQEIADGIAQRAAGEIHSVGRGRQAEKLRGDIGSAAEKGKEGTGVEARRGRISPKAARFEEFGIVPELRGDAGRPVSVRLAKVEIDHEEGQDAEGKQQVERCLPAVRSEERRVGKEWRWWWPAGG